MADISKEQLEKEIAKILENANLAKTTTKKVIKQLEKDLGVDLTKKKDVIDQLVMDYVNSKESDEDDDDDKADKDFEEEEEEEVEKKPTRRAAATKTRSRGQTTYIKVKRWHIPNEEEVNYVEESDEDEPPKKKGKKKKADGEAKEAKGKKGGGRGKGGGYTRAYKLSPQLAELMGEDKMARHEVVKRVWAIIKQKELYDPSNKQFAICDDALLKVFGTKRFRTFGMMKYLKTHFIDE